MSKKHLIKSRKFNSGATRNSNDGKLDYEGYFSPLVLERIAQHMYQHRFLENGEIRPSDNWQKGIPKDVYMKSGFRHFMAWWKKHRKIENEEELEELKDLEEVLCALIFNASGYLFEILKENEIKNGRHRQSS